MWKWGKTKWHNKEIPLRSNICNSCHISPFQWVWKPCLYLSTGMPQKRLVPCCNSRFCWIEGDPHCYCWIWERRWISLIFALPCMSRAQESWAVQWLPWKLWQHSFFCQLLFCAGEEDSLCWLPTEVWTNLNVSSITAKKKVREIPLCLRLDTSIPRKEALKFLVFLFSSVFLRQHEWTKLNNEQFLIKDNTVFKINSF